MSLNAFESTQIRNSITYKKPMLSSLKRNSLWYGGDVASFEYKGNTYTLCANGDVVATLIIQNEHESSSIPVQDRSNLDIFGETMSKYIDTDETLHRLIMGFNVNGMELLLQNNNWWEVFVVDKKGNTNTFCCDSENYDEALSEMIESVNWANPVPQMDDEHIVYVYHETNDDAPFGEMLTVVFKDQKDARNYLRQRVENYFHKPWAQCRELVIPPDEPEPDNTFTTDYVCYGPTGDGYCFWSIENHIIH